MYKPYNIGAFGPNHKNRKRNRRCVKDSNFLGEIDQILASGTTPEQERYVHSHLYTNKAWVPKWLLIDLLGKIINPDPVSMWDAMDTPDNTILFTANRLFEEYEIADQLKKVLDESGNINPVVEFTFDEETGKGQIVFGKPVASLNGAVFYECPLVEVSLPKTVKEIGNSCFEGCQGLKNIYINSESGISIGYSAFKRSGLENIYITATNDYHMHHDEFTFKHNRAHTNAFSGLKSMPTIYTWEERVGYYATHPFLDFPVVKAIPIPSNEIWFECTSVAHAFINDPGGIFDGDGNPSNLMDTKYITTSDGRIIGSFIFENDVVRLNGAAGGVFSESNLKKIRFGSTTNYFHNATFKLSNIETVIFQTPSQLDLVFDEFKDAHLLTDIYFNTSDIRITQPDICFQGTGGMNTLYKLGTNTNTVRVHAWDINIYDKWIWSNPQSAADTYGLFDSSLFGATSFQKCITTLPNNMIWFKTTGNEAWDINRPDVFMGAKDGSATLVQLDIISKRTEMGPDGSEIIYHEYNPQTKCGRHRFDGDVLQLAGAAFMNNDSYKDVILSPSLYMLGTPDNKNSCFEGCGELDTLVVLHAGMMSQIMDGIWDIPYDLYLAYSTIKNSKIGKFVSWAYKPKTRNSSPYDGIKTTASDTVKFILPGQYQATTPFLPTNYQDFSSGSSTPVVSFEPITKEVLDFCQMGWKTNEL